MLLQEKGTIKLNLKQTNILLVKDLALRQLICQKCGDLMEPGALGLVPE